MYCFGGFVRFAARKLARRILFLESVTGSTKKMKERVAVETQTGFAWNLEMGPLRRKLGARN
jgi:hypothetical protein